jgi:hypothetical protein
VIPPFGKGSSGGIFRQYPDNFEALNNADGVTHCGQTLCQPYLMEAIPLA